MPVISPRRYSTTTGSSFLPPSGTYRSTYSSSTANERGTSSYTSDITSYGSRSNYFSSINRSSLGNSSSSTSATTTSKYGGLTSKYLRASADKELPPTGSTSRYPRGDSRTRDRDLTSSGNTPSSSLRLATTAADLYEKYSPSSYIPKCELTRSRSLSEAQKLTKEKTPTKDSYNSSNSTGGTTSSLSKVKLCALTSSPPPIPTHLNNNNNINNNNINYNNKTTSSVTNNNSAYFGLNNNKQQQQQNTTDACIAITNAATSFIIDSFSNKSTKLRNSSSDVAGAYTTGAMNPINNTHFIHNNLSSRARTKNLYNMKGSSGMTTTSNEFSSNNSSSSNSGNSNNFGGLKNDIGILQTTYKSSYSNNSSSSNKDMLKNEIDFVRSQLKSKSSEINNNSHKLLSSSTKSISNNLINNNNNNSNSVNNNNNTTSSNGSISNHLNGHHNTNGISKITLPVKPLIHSSKNSLLTKQNSLSNNDLMPNGGSRHNSLSELEAVTNKVLNSRTKFLPKPKPTTISSTSNNGEQIGDDLKFIDTDDTTSNDRLNRDTLTSIGTVRLLPTTPTTKLFKINNNNNDSNYENDKLSSNSSSSSSSSPNTINIKNLDDIQQQIDNGIDSSNGSSNSSTWDSTPISSSINTTTMTTTITTTQLINGNGAVTTTTTTTMTTIATPTATMTTMSMTGNLSLQPATNNCSTTTTTAIDDKQCTTTKLIETDFDNSDSYRNASSRAALPPTERTSKYWERERPSLASRTLSDSDSFALSKSAFTSSSSLTDPYDRGTSTETADGLCGLRNIGNTCFMNSVLQCLSHTNELTKFLRNQYAPKTTTKDQRILAEFVKLIKDMWSGSRSVTPLELKSSISSKYRMYSGSAQQDAQEFLRFFLDTLHCALNTGTKGEKLEIDDNLSDTKKADLTWEWYSRVESSLVKDLFVGQLKSSLKCTVCGNTSVTFDPFWDLSLPLPSSTTRCKLESCLDLFIKEEVLDGDEMPTCSKCKARRKSTKTFTIQRFPKYLVIHLKRFSETRWSKLTTIVEFPTGERELEMSPYASSSNTSSSKYTLYGISNHMGSTAGGHYVALCKHPLLKKWHEFNDNVVSDSSDYNLVSSSAYLLFYERS